MICVEGEVIHGKKIGRALGFPTANMSLQGHEDIERGVYRSEVDIDGQHYRAMSNVGVRPSVDSTGRWLETHIFDFSGNLYGKTLRVELLEKIRNERKFSSVAELRAQLEHDMEYCKENVK